MSGKLRHAQCDIMAIQSIIPTKWFNLYLYLQSNWTTGTLKSALGLLLINKWIVVGFCLILTQEFVLKASVSEAHPIVPNNSH